MAEFKRRRGKPLRSVKSVSILSGPGKVGKTTHEIAWAIHSIMGGKFAGQLECQKGHTVAWWDAENSIASTAMNEPSTAIASGQLHFQVRTASTKTSSVVTSIVPVTAMP